MAGPDWKQPPGGAPGPEQRLPSPPEHQESPLTERRAGPGRSLGALQGRGFAGSELPEQPLRGYPRPVSLLPRDQVLVNHEAASRRGRG